MKPTISNRGISFIEMTVAIGLAAVCSLPILWMISSTRTDTSKAINYLRALELANEAMDWVQSADLETQGAIQVSSLNGSLAESSGSGFRATHVAMAPGGSPGGPLHYSEQYNRAFFYRTIRVEDVPGSLPQARFLRQITVTVWWNEGHVPVSLEGIGATPDRDRRVTLSCLVPKAQEGY